MKVLDREGVLYLLQRLSGHLAGKVDAEEGKGLSSNDFTDVLREKLEGWCPADWQQPDPDGPGYLRNRPFGSRLTRVLEKTEVQNLPVRKPETDLLPAGESLLVEWDGSVFSCRSREKETGKVCFGDPAWDQEGAETPFYFEDGILYGGEGAHTVAVSLLEKQLLDAEWLEPQSLRLLLERLFPSRGGAMHYEGEAESREKLPDKPEPGEVVRLSAEGIFLVYDGEQWQAPDPDALGREEIDRALEEGGMTCR